MCATISVVTAGFTFHHVGVAVQDLEQASGFYTSVLGFRLVAGPIEDPIQKVRASFLAEAASERITLELISPLGADSPINGYLSKSTGAYHVCYEVNDLASTLRGLRKNGCLIVGKPVTAVAYGGRNIAWCFTPTNQLLELLERDNGSAEAAGWALRA